MQSSIGICDSIYANRRDRHPSRGDLASWNSRLPLRVLSLLSFFFACERYSWGILFIEFCLISHGNPFSRNRVATRFAYQTFILLRSYYLRKFHTDQVDRDIAAEISSSRLSRSRYCEHRKSRRKFAAGDKKLPTAFYAVKSKGIIKLIVIAVCRPASASGRRPLVFLAFVCQEMTMGPDGLRPLITLVICGWRDKKREQREREASY